MISTIDLGWCIAKLDTNTNKLIIVSPSDGNDGVFQPSESVHVFGKDALIRLRNALNKAYTDA